MISEHLKKLQAGTNFSEPEASEIMNALLSEELTQAQTAALLTGFAFKGETADEITGFARTMRKHAVKLDTKKRPLIDTAGTGGGRCTFNISTTAALVTAGAGLVVAKHGNTSFTSRCGSADVLKKLGVNIDASTDLVQKCLNEIGIGFLFAPRFHPAVKKVANVRKELGIRTMFNLLGPLNNPADAEFQLLGVYEENLTDLMAKVLANLGSSCAWVVHSVDGMDEISACDLTKVTELKDGRTNSFYVYPEDVGVKPVKIEELMGGESDYNAKITLAVLAREIKNGPRSAVVINAGAALFIAGKVADLRSAIDLANESIDSGAALKKLEDLKKITNA